MRKSVSMFHKTFNIFLSFVFLLQSVAPAISLQIAYADETTPTPEVTAAPTEDPTPAPEITAGPTQEVTPTQTETPSPSAQSELTATETPAEPQVSEPQSNNDNAQSPANENAQSQAPPTSPTITVAPTEPKEDGVLSATILENVSAPSLDLLDLSTITDGQSASIITDKADYAPTDTALITGSGFTPNKTYSLTISSSDEPATSTTVDVTADANGTFIYAYQLDGTYRPDYKVEVKDGDTVVATTTFTDSVTVTPASGGTNISGNKAQNGSSPAYTTLGNIVITEQSDTDFAASQTNKTLILTAPNNWSFNSGIGSVSFQNSRDITSASISVVSQTITITFTTDGTANKSDILTISGIQVRAIDGSIVPSAGNILRTSGNPGTGSIVGISNDVTNFGSLSQTAASVSVPPLPASGCFNDAQGADDEPGQKDLTKMCTDTNNVPTNIKTWWNWDDTAWSGNNTGSACNLFDTDGDGNANYSMCVFVGGSPASFQSRTLYSCGDDRIDRCTNPIAAQTTTASCGAAVMDEDPFNASNDTVGYCSTNLSELGSASNVSLIDVCSYPSEQPNSDPSDCIFYKKSTGKLVVNKILNPTTDTGKFNLQVDFADKATDVGNGGTTGEQVLDIGNHTVGEIAGTGTSLSNYTSAISCRLQHGTGNVIASSSNSDPLTVPVADGDDIVCDITNTRVNNATITIIKDANPNDAQDFAFTASGSGLTNFTLDDDGDNSNGTSNTKTFSSLAVGTYSVSEDVVSGWTQTSATCSDGSPVSAINLSSGETVTCTFTNTKDATLKLVKTVTNNNGGNAVANDFQAKIDGDNVAWNAAQVISASSQTASETNLPGYTASNWGGDCAANGTVTLNPGDNKVCTITNDDIGPQLTVIKHVINDNGGTATASAFTMLVTGTNVSQTLFGGNESGTQINLDAGSYSVGEIGLDGYASSLSTDCTGTIKIGESKTCTITNDDIQPKLTVTKVVVNKAGSNGQVSDFPLFVDQTQVISGVQNNFDSGNYVVSETGPDGYSSVIDGDCDENGNVSLDSGDEKACTITNTRDTGSITVTKEVLPNNTDSQWDIEVSGPTNNNDTLSDGESTDKLISVIGDYTVTETGHEGTDNNDYVSNYVCTAGEQEIKSGNGREATFTLNEGNDVNCVFTNKKKGNLIIVKYNDRDGDGKKNENEEILSGWKFTATELDSIIGLSDTTNGNGEIVFMNLVPDSYLITEDQKSNWEQTNIDCNNELRVEQADLAVVFPGQTTTCKVGNKSILPVLTIAKTNDKLGQDLHTGDSIIYTITVYASQSAAFNVTVTDLLPQGITYQSGSWGATSNFDGVLSLGEPTYASPGTWSLGNMDEGEIITLTYTAKINSDQQAGFYKDLAWGKAEAVDDTPVLALALPEGYVDTYFVGTQVNIVKDPDGSSYNVEKKETKDVLGAATSLPSTGANPQWLTLATMLTLIGLSLLSIGYIIRRRYA